MADDTKDTPLDAPIMDYDARWELGKETLTKMLATMPEYLGGTFGSHSLWNTVFLVRRPDGRMKLISDVADHDLLIKMLVSCLEQCGYRIEMDQIQLGPETVN